MFYAGLSQQKGYRRPMLGGLRGLGDIPLAGWAAGTLLKYSNTNLHSNTWIGYTDEQIQNAVANTGLFIPTTVVVETSGGGLFGLTSYNILVSGVLPVAVNQSDASRVIEGILASFFDIAPSTGLYDPPPNAVVNVNPASGKVTSSAPTTQTGQVARASSFGITSAGQYADGSTYVALSDGSVLSFDNQGDPVSEDFGLSGVSFAIAYDAGTTGVVMTDGTEFIFDANGKAILPASGTVTPTGAIQTVNTKPVTTTSTIQTGISSTAAALGLGTGAFLAIVGIGAFVLLSKK